MYFVKFMPEYFFEAIVDGAAFLSSFSASSLLVYRKATDFYRVILYPAALLKVYIRSKTLLVES
jgi:hypothetical protein